VKIFFENPLTLIVGKGARAFRFCHWKTQHSWWQSWLVLGQECV